MLHPRTPVESIPPSRFHPPFCPRPHCPEHRRNPGGPRFYVRDGFYARKCDRRRVQVFQCKTCDGHFSQQSFAVTYSMKRPELLLPVAAWMTSGAPLRRIARALPHSRPGLRPCHPSTVPRIARRIGSQCALALVEHFRQLPEIQDPVAGDHFETFVGEQENALGVLTPVHATAGYTYFLEPAWHRRATARARAEPKVAPSPGEVGRSFRLMLDRLISKVPEGGTLEIVTDEHPDYPREVRRRRQGAPIRHRVHRNPPDRRRGDPPTPETVARDRAMFPVDVLHKWFRHVDADHRRESIAFCRRGEAVVERLSAVVVARNLIQGVSERRNDARTPGMLVGLTSRPWTWGEVLARRRWPERIGIDETTRTVVERTMRDPRGIVWPRHVRRRSL